MFPDNRLCLRNIVDRRNLTCITRMKDMNDTKDTFLVENESNALTFSLISHLYLSSLKRLVYMGFREIGESMRDKTQT